MAETMSAPSCKDLPDDTSSIAPSYLSDVTLPLTPARATHSSAAAPSYTDDAVISVTIPAADLEDSDNESPSQNPGQTQPRRKSFLGKFKPSRSKPDHIVMMTRGDYLRYWARDKQGRYIGTEPEGTGRGLLRQRRVANNTPGQFQMPGQEGSQRQGSQGSAGPNVPLSQHHGEGETIVGDGPRKSQKVEDKFAAVEGTMPQALSYGSYIPSGMGFGKANKQKRMLEGLDLQRK